MTRRGGDVSISASMVEQRADYDAAKQSQFVRRRTGISSSGSGADFHYRNESDWLKCLEFSRDLDRNHMLIGSAVNKVVDSIVQTGVLRDAQTGNSEADTILEDSWDEWAGQSTSCHNEQRLNWQQIERLVFRSAFIVDGDHIVFPTDEGQLWCVEAHRLRKPRNTKKRVVHGIELDDRDRVKAYWITKRDVGAEQSVKLVSEVEQYPAFDAAGNPLAWFISDPTRTSQRRGVGKLLPVMNAAGMIDDSLFADLVKKQASSCIAILRQIARDAVPHGMPGTLGETEVVTAGDNAQRLIERLYPGMEVVGKPGETISMFTPNIQTSESHQFTMFMLMVLAVNIGLPLSVMLLDPSNTNFSGWRGALDQARLGYRRMINDYIQQFHVNVWRWRVRVNLAREDKVGERLRELAQQDGVNLFGHRWNAKSYGYIEPLKDATANRLRIESLQTSPRRLHAELAQNWFEVIDETVEDNKYAIAKAVKAMQELQEEFPVVLDSLHWRELLCLTATQPLAITVAATEANMGGQNAL